MATKNYFEVIKYIGKKEPSQLLHNVTGAINDYLRNNQGNASDFHLLKNIVDRHTDTVEEEINQLLPVPLYCGLVATMIGIIFGLFNLDGDVSSENFVNSIGLLLGSIKWAMICSVFGLICTTCLTFFFYRPAKVKLENQKNVLYNFIQKKLLPHLNEDAVSTIVNMQANLREFNKTFGSNIQSFTGIMNEIKGTFDSQVKLLHTMERMDMAQMAKFNTNVLAELQMCMEEFQKFTRYMHQMNEFVNNTTKLTDSVNRQLDRTHAVESVFNDVKENVDRNREVMDMLSNFLLRVNEQEALLTAAGQFDEAVKEQLNAFKHALNRQIEDMTNHTAQASKDLDVLMNKERGQLDRLSNLEKLKDLLSAIKSMEENNKSVNHKLAQKIEDLTKAINSSSQRASNGGFPLSSAMTNLVAVSVLLATICVIVSSVAPLISKYL